MTGGPAVVSSVAVLNGVAQNVSGFAAALTQGTIGTTISSDRMPSTGRSVVGVWIDTMDLAAWASENLIEDLALLTRKVVRRAAFPAQTGAGVAMVAIHDAALTEQQIAATAVLIAGSNLALDYQVRAAFRYRDEGRLAPSHSLTHTDIDVLGAVSEVTGCRGEGCVVGASAASGTIALIHAVRLVLSGEAEHCLVVGPCAELSELEFQSLMDSAAMASPGVQDDAQRICRPFDAGRRGFVFGQGAAAVVVEREETATARGRRPLARITGFGQRLDGRRGMDPDSGGQVAAMRAALDRAGIGPEKIDYVNTHGTGTLAGDRCEAESVYQVFGSRPLVNSTKALIGHCYTGAGLQEAIATVLQMSGGFCHPNPNLEDPCHPGLSFVPSVAVPHTIGAAISNSFAFSGVSSSLVLEPYVEAPR